MESDTPFQWGMVIATALAIGILMFLVVRGIPAAEYTELYFENIDELPKKVTLDERYSFSFSIVNKEEDEKTYSYEVWKELDASKVLLASGTATLGIGEKATMVVDFEVGAEFETGQILVEADQKEIYFSLQEATA